jgi:hypothetical protein
MDQKIKFLALYDENNNNLYKTCLDIGIARTTGHGWLQNRSKIEATASDPTVDRR